MLVTIIAFAVLLFSAELWVPLALLFGFLKSVLLWKRTKREYILPTHVCRIVDHL